MDDNLSRKQGRQDGDQSAHEQNNQRILKRCQPYSNNVRSK